MCHISRQCMMYDEFKRKEEKNKPMVNVLKRILILMLGLLNEITSFAFILLMDCNVCEWLMDEGKFIKCAYDL